MTTVISATNRKNSISLLVAEYYLNQLENKGHPASLLSLTDLPADMLSPDFQGSLNENFKKIQEQIFKTTKFLFIIPEYNGSFPGVLKAFIDACKFPESFNGKKAALVGVAAGRYGNIRGVEHFTGICMYIGMHVMPQRLHIPSVKNELDTGNNLFRENTVRFVNQQIDKFIAF